MAGAEGDPVHERVQIRRHAPSRSPHRRTSAATGPVVGERVREVRERPCELVVRERPRLERLVARKTRGTTKKTASQASPGASRAYGVDPAIPVQEAPHAPTGRAPSATSRCLVVCERRRVEMVQLRERRFVREDQRVFASPGRSSRSPRGRLSPASDVVHVRRDLRGDRRVVDEVHEGRRGEDAAARSG